MTSRSLYRLIKPFQNFKTGLRFDHHHSPSFPINTHSVYEEFRKERQRQKEKELENQFRGQIIQELELHRQTFYAITSELKINHIIPNGLSEAVPDKFKKLK